MAEKISNKTQLKGNDHKNVKTSVKFKLKIKCVHPA